MTPDKLSTDAQAAEWAVRLSAGTLDVDAQTALDTWLTADPRHRGALVRARAAWADFDRLGALSGRTHREDTQRHALEERSPGRAASRAAAAATNRRWFLAAGLTAFTLAGAGGGWWLWRRRGEVYESDIGEIRRVTLADGSSMLLNTATEAVVAFSPKLRHVELVRGEAVFDVAKDTARPFTVRARGVSIRAVGTVFAVRAFDENVNVTVTEGVVEVSDASLSGSAAPQRVTASERAVVSSAQGINIQRVSQAQVERHLAWREGMLSFDGESLSDAVAEINRHNVRQIVIDDSALAARPVVGIFRASDEQGFAETVAAAMGAESRAEGDVIRLRAGTAR